MSELNLHNFHELYAYCRDRRRWGRDLLGVIQTIENRLRRQMEDSGVAGDPRFTGLQKKAFSTPAYWSQPEEEGGACNLIVQGATSAGKTLVSEIAVLDTLKQNKKALVLVPLKSMVRERYNRFCEDFKGTGYRIYASSSDYLDYDEALLENEYDVAILVNEKLFALLCQPDNHLLKNCGLIIVDELATIGDNDRGPKLEVVLQKAMTCAEPPRILCLATADCDARHIRTWLSAQDDDGLPAEVIRHAGRPVGLNEYVVYRDGRYRVRGIPGELEPADTPETVDEGRFEVSTGPEKTTREQKKNLLTAVLKQLYSPDSDRKPKTLVFVATQSSAQATAKLIAGMDLPLEDVPSINREQRAREMAHRAETTRHFQQMLNQCDMDDELLLLRDTLLPKGVAFHHGSMSVNLRETLEEQFARDPSLKVIVATETLTIGVNLPIDCVVLYDVEVPRGTGGDRAVSFQPLTLQQYYNYIGRAGRLGMSEQRGETYLLALEKNQSVYWEEHGKQPDVISSALKKADEETLAPYYLNLLASNQSHTFSKTRIREIHQASLARVCSTREVQAETLIEDLQDYLLAEVDKAEITKQPPARRRRVEADMPSILNEYGKLFSPYAFDLQTAYNLRIPFVNGTLDDTGDEQIPFGFVQGMPAEYITADRYLLDILYWVISRNRELQQSSINLKRDSNNPETDMAIRRQLQTALYRIRPKAGQPVDGEPSAYTCELWPNSDLEQLFYGEQPDLIMENYTSLFRALLMFYWVKGLSAHQIRNDIGITCGKFSNGDLERFANSVSYQIDAASKIMSLRQDSNDQPLVGAMRHLSSRIKYGLPADLIVFANRHVHGLDRARLIKFGQAAKAAGMTPMDYLRSASPQRLEAFFTRSQQEGLRSRLQKRFGGGGSFELLMKKLTELNVSQKWKSSLQQLYECSRDSEDAFDLLEQLLCQPVLEDGKQLFRACGRLEAARPRRACPDSRMWEFFDHNNRTSRYILVTYCAVPEDEQELPMPVDIPEREVLNDLFGIGQQQTVTSLLLLGGSRFPREDLLPQLARGHYDLCLSCENLAQLLASAVPLGGGTDQTNGVRDCVDLLYELLDDARGVFSHEKLQYSWLNYDPACKTDDAVEYQILLDQDLSNSESKDLLSRLRNSGGALANYRILPWGAQLDREEFLAKPTVVLLNRRKISGRRSLNRFLYNLSQTDPLRNKLLVLANDPYDQKHWSAHEPNPTDLLPWPGVVSQYPAVFCRELDDFVGEIRQFLHKQEMLRQDHFLIGVSYAHYDEYSAKDDHLSPKKQLEMLVHCLNRAFGEDLILWDGNHRARPLFSGDREQALTQYGYCKVGIVLYNDWSLRNDWCRRERKRMTENGVLLHYLSEGPHLRQQDTGLVLETLPRSEEDCERLIQDIREQLRKLE